MLAKQHDISQFYVAENGHIIKDADLCSTDGQPGIFGGGDLGLVGGSGNYFSIFNRSQNIKERAHAAAEPLDSESPLVAFIFRRLPSNFERSRLVEERIECISTHHFGASETGAVNKFIFICNITPQRSICR